MEFEGFSTDKLIELALAENDDDKRWNYIIVLHKKELKTFLRQQKACAKAASPKKLNSVPIYWDNSEIRNCRSKNRRSRF